MNPGEAEKHLGQAMAAVENIDKPEDRDDVLKELRSMKPG